ncbi:MAG TPA: hypothetical protein VM283_08065, partial [Armatimonadota bacterium]|nr:hypothetical protein [Armatimonadota bacterium]
MRGIVRRTWYLIALGALAGPLTPALGQGQPQEHLVDIGGGMDDTLVGEGIHNAENPGPGDKYDQFFHTCSFRWFANHWTMTVPAFPGRD